MEIKDLHLPDHHQDVLDRFVRVCQADERVLAAFLGGSYAHGTADGYSDIDLFLITTDEAYQEFIAQREAFIRLLGQPLFLEDFGIPHAQLFILSDSTEGELMIGRKSRFHHICEGPYVVLLDKKGLLANVVFPPRQSDPGHQIKTLCEQINGFWHEMAHFIKAMGRKQLWFAAGELEVMRLICVNLARLQYNFTDRGVGEEPYFKIEQALPVENLSPLETTFCGMEYEAILQAAFVILRFYRGLAQNLAREHGLAYPADLDRILVNQLEELAL